MSRPNDSPTLQSHRRKVTAGPAGHGTTTTRPAKEKKGTANRKVSGSGRSQSSEGNNPKDAVGMRQARQVCKARREEGVRETGEPWTCCKFEVLELAREQGP